MLRLYLDDIPSNIKFIDDVEKKFASLFLKCTDKEKEIVSKIEQGELIDSISFIDRFGYKLYTSELSTGCKAALCVLNCPDCVINLVECGLNARDAIISLCDEGAVLFETNSATISNKYVEEVSICVQVNEYVFNSIDRLNCYIFNEYPFEPDLNVLGIKFVGECI